VGAPSTQRPWNRGQATFALTHPSKSRETGAVTASRLIAQTFAETGRVAVATGGGVRRGVKTVPSRSNA
jgi:hypothetical protein